MKEIILYKISRLYQLEKKEMGALAHIHKGVYDFSCETYEIKGVGNLFFINMKAMMGLMKMETAIITPLQKDLSFCNYDVVKAMGNETYIFEMYDSSLKKTDLSAFEPIKEKYSHLPEYRTESRWYDALKLDSCIGKKGKKITAEAEKMIEECVDQYLSLLQEASDCDPEAKKAAVAGYVDRLISEGGVAVDSMKKIIGEEKTATLVRQFMYGL